MRYLNPAHICLPDFNKVDGTKWATVACDQFTSQPEYWDAAYELVGDAPSTLALMLPEAFLEHGDQESKIQKINQNMRDYLKDVLISHNGSMIYLERVQSDGRVRRGIIGKIDLDLYDYHAGADTLIRATEKTVIERIPPRVNIRRGAVVEMPHIMMLIDDPERRIIEVTAANKEKYPVAYDFDLMAGGGHVTGRFIDADEVERINCELEALATPEKMKEKYGMDAAPLLFAIGDGNHSLAGAKALYEEIKAEIGVEAAREHPARYALCEMVNLHDDALEFEPIYRVLFGVDVNDFLEGFKVYANTPRFDYGKEPQKVEYLFGDTHGEIYVNLPESRLAVGSTQRFVDAYMQSHPEVTCDYIHGLDIVKQLAQKENSIALYFDGMAKDELFATVIQDGALPRKTFSMGHAEDKRYYIECRKIREL